MRSSLLALSMCFVMMIGCGHTQTQVNKNQGKIYTYQTDSNGFDTKNFFYDNGKEIVVFDAQFTEEYARKSIAQIRSQSQSPIKYLVITHPNPDKFNGMKAFQALGAKVIASQKTVDALEDVHAYKRYYFTKIAKSFTEETYPALGKVDVVFQDRYTIQLTDGEEIQLTELGQAGVSSNQTIAFLPQRQSYFVGDLIHHKAHAWLEGGIVGGKPVSDLKLWQKTLDLFAQRAEASATVYGGRGEAATLKEAVEAQKVYLQRAEEIVATYIQELGEKSSELKSDAAAKHHQALQERFVRAFPDYALPYMIGYGVYGLVMAKLP